MGVFIKVSVPDISLPLWVDGDLKLTTAAFACNFHVEALAEKALISLRSEHPGMEFVVVECGMGDPNHPWS
jgi:hypothetical protein